MVKVNVVSRLLRIDFLNDIDFGIERGIGMIPVWYSLFVLNAASFDVCHFVKIETSIVYLASSADV